jgi:hypothetical protein
VPIRPDAERYSLPVTVEALDIVFELMPSMRIQQGTEPCCDPMAPGAC